MNKTLLLLSSGVIIGGCGLDFRFKGKPTGQPINLPIEALVDKNFSSQQISELEESFAWANEFEAPRTFVSKASRWYEEIFGSSSSADLMVYLDTRISYFVSPQTTYQSNIKLSTVRNRQALATNIGAAIFMHSKANDSDIIYEFGAGVIDIKSPRVGLVKLNNAFFDQETSQAEAKNFRLMSVLVHEARHSDCTGGIKRSEILNEKKGVEHVDNSCSHLHTYCPAGHDYAGYAACDNHPWGAYAVSAVHAARIAECDDCSEEIVQVALATALDQGSRVMIEKKLFSGSLGLPNMSHSDIVVEDLN